ncbi:MAG: hypothetical protein VR64_13085 [Desulfatitalea sp. BRH_c12]|nr:MAG: hypothetical protein VR64_13085 [Desulfatitalea sp. BRH_c12]
MNETKAMLDPQICEKARLSRDPRFDGLFFTGVLSTGIFCRPVCPAPQPKAANVVYFASAAAAAEAGLKPCLRCRPETAPGTPAWNGTSATTARAMHLIRQGVLNDGSVDSLAARLGMGSRQLRRLFRQHIGATPTAMANVQRVLFAKKLLAETDLPVTQIAFASGFGSLRRFNAAFRKTYRESPSAFRHKGPHPQNAGHFKCALTLAYRPPLHWERMLAFYRDRAIPGVESVGANAYHRIIRIDDGVGIIHVQPAAKGHAVRLEATLPDSRGLMRLVEQVRRMFDLDANMQAIVRTLAADGILAPIVARLEGMRLPGAWDVFETAMRAVVGQQISVKAAQTILGRIVQRTAGTYHFDNAVGLTHCFPTAATLAQADLTGLGMSVQRTRTLQALARTIATEPGFLEVRSTLDDFVRRATALPGIGPWTAQYIALRGLGEPDAFPAGDLGLAQALSENGIRPKAHQVLARAEAWRPWRAYAAIYLWNR